MKAVIFILLCCLVSSFYGQDLIKETEPTPQEIYDFHMKKNKNLKTAGWITFSGGLIMLGSSLVIAARHILTWDDNLQTASALSIIGAISFLSSPILFIMAGDQKKKANLQLLRGAVGLNNEIDYYGLSISYSF